VTDHIRGIARDIAAFDENRTKSKARFHSAKASANQFVGFFQLAGRAFVFFGPTFSRPYARGSISMPVTGIKMSPFHA